MYYYILNGIEIGIFLCPVYIDDPILRLFYMGLLFHVINSDLPFYYSEIKNRLLKL